MKIGVLKEVKVNEKRVAITPSLIPKITKLGHEIYIESNSGLGSNFHDKQYSDNGAKICTKEEVFECDIILNPLKNLFQNYHLRKYSYHFSVLLQTLICLKSAKKTELTYYPWIQCQEFQERKKWMHYPQWQTLQAQELS